MRTVVSNTGPLITLETMRDGYEFIQRLYDKIIVPPEVLKEVSWRLGDPKKYLQEHQITHLIETQEASSIIQVKEFANLHRGEIEAISLAVELKLGLLIEDRDGRRVANKLCFSISGIAGRVMEALKRQIIGKNEGLDKIQELFDKKRLNLATYKDLTQKILTS
ncbi:MAG: hypothetical protein HQK57_02570 [Deltaproteobacteria bacterium]|nr:hypothetical protein [Deltaproteobacteria bacterium]MBF0524601.1 hypothetical protein [Deltaproteobacteria bacterium]